VTWRAKLNLAYPLFPRHARVVCAWRRRSSAFQYNFTFLSTRLTRFIMLTMTPSITSYFCLDKLVYKYAHYLRVCWLKFVLLLCVTTKAAANDWSEYLIDRVLEYSLIPDVLFQAANDKEGVLGQGLKQPPIYMCIFKSISGLASCKWNRESK